MTESPGLPREFAERSRVTCSDQFTESISGRPRGKVTCTIVWQGTAWGEKEEKAEEFFLSSKKSICFWLSLDFCVWFYFNGISLAFPNLLSKSQNVSIGALGLEHMCHGAQRWKYFFHFIKHCFLKRHPNVRLSCWEGQLLPPPQWETEWTPKSQIRCLIFFTLHVRLFGYLIVETGQASPVSSRRPIMYRHAIFTLQHFQPHCSWNWP